MVDRTLPRRVHVCPGGTTRLSQREPEPGQAQQDRRGKQVCNQSVQVCSAEHVVSKADLCRCLPRAQEARTAHIKATFQEKRLVRAIIGSHLSQKQVTAGKMSVRFRMRAMAQAFRSPSCNVGQGTGPQEIRSSAAKDAMFIAARNGRMRGRLRAAAHRQRSSAGPCTKPRMQSLT